MATQTEIVNLALSYLGQQPIANLLDPKTTVEQIAAVQYPIIRDAVLEAHNWTFAIERAVLTTPNAAPPEWGFANAFLLPLDCLRVVWAGRNTKENQYDCFDWRVEGEELVTDPDVVYIRYVKRLEDTTKYSALFVQMFAHRMAMEMCIAITENVQLYNQLVSVYGTKVNEAVANDGMQGRSQVIKQRVLGNVR